MDVVRKTKRRSLLNRPWILVVLGVTFAASGLFALVRIKPPLPLVARDRIVLGVVKRGEMLRNVRGAGRLVSEEVTVITSETGGRVKQILIQRGALVEKGTVLLILDNPQVEKSLMDAQLSLRTTQAGLMNLQVQIQQQNLNVKAATAQAIAAYEEALLQSQIDDELWKNGLISKRQHRLSLSRAEQALNLRDIQLERVRLSKETTEEELAIQKQRVALSQHSYELQQKNVESLNVVAEVAGVVQQIGPSARNDFEIGNQVSNGTTLAIMSNPDRLKAELEIPQAQAQDIQVGQSVHVEAVSSREVIPGKVIQIDPKVQEGTVTVEVALLGNLPKGTRPDLSVYGTVEIERINDVLYMDRPLYGQASSTAKLFKLVEKGNKAIRTSVKLGRISTSTIEVLQGLVEGESVILSDMTSLGEIDLLAIR